MQGLMVIHREQGWMNDTQNLYVHIPPVQQQRGSADCGVVAIAFAFHAAMGDEIKGFGVLPE